MARLLFELAACRDVGVLGDAVVDVERAGRDLEQRLARGDTPLADHQEPIIVVEREDRDGPRVANDVARPARAVGALDRVHAELHVPPAMDQLGRDDALLEGVSHHASDQQRAGPPRGRAGSG